jgi:hypothetical protein
VHPIVIETYLGGAMVKAFEDMVEEEIAKPSRALTKEEQQLMHLLRQRLAASSLK